MAVPTAAAFATLPERVRRAHFESPIAALAAPSRLHPLVASLAGRAAQPRGEALGGAPRARRPPGRPPPPAQRWRVGADGAPAAPAPGAENPFSGANPVLLHVLRHGQGSLAQSAQALEAVHI